MSTRQELASRIALFIATNDMTTPYGGDVMKDGKYYGILFSKPAVLDGLVKVYGPKFIQISYATQYRAMPSRGNRVFENEHDAIDFLRKAFVSHDFDGALAIPTKTK
jgi:hypothetical protein